MVAYGGEMFGFGAVIQRDFRTSSLPRFLPRDNLNVCVI